MKRFLRPAKAAEYLGLAPQTLARWRVEGSPVPFSRLGRAVVYNVDDLDEWVRVGRAGSTAEADALKSTAAHHRQGRVR